MFSIYESIIDCLEAHGKSIEDIEWVGDDSVHAWWEFRQLPKKPATEHKIKALNYNQFPLEERRIAHQLLLQKYQKTNAQEDDPYRPEFLLREMLYKK